MCPNRDSELHTHPCGHCGTPAECWGALEANDDGWPLVRCVLYHLDSGQIDDDFLCDACQLAALQEREP